MNYLRALHRSLLLAGIAALVFVQLLVSLVLILPAAVGLIFLLPQLVSLTRPMTSRWRALFGRWSGAPIPPPYAPPPAPLVPEPDGLYRHDNTLYKSERAASYIGRLMWLSKDRATWRDLTWVLLHPLISGALAFGPLLLIGYGVVAPLASMSPLWTSALVPLGVLIAPWTVRASLAWNRHLLAPLPQGRLDRLAARRERTQQRLQSWPRAGLLLLLALLNVPMLLITLVCFGLGFGLGMIFLIPTATGHFRWLANFRRQLALWGGVTIPRPYAPQLLPERRPDGLYRVRNSLYKTDTMASMNARWLWMWQDLASWRDIAWLAVDPLVSTAILVLPLVAAGYGAWGLALPWLWSVLFGADWSRWYGAVDGSRALAAPVGVALAVLGVATAPLAVRLHARWTAVLLAPTRATALRQRVERLTQTRTDATDAQAAEVRRIERDLHDGAQARLIAVGLTLGAIERLMERDPPAARQLLAQARDTSATALAELRDLVRGIHPPVLSERGLPDAVRALALDISVSTGITAGVSAELPGRLDPAVESAAYFAVSETLANAAKHADARRITVDLRHHAGMLRMTVTDDGHGGADRSRGTGLRGVERRLGTFDGTLALHSPGGGPTVVTMEVPCALSLPKTSTC